jgi:hypothetical protein
MCVCIECINLNIQELFLGELFQALISLAETKGLFGNPHGAGPGSPGATRTCSVACPSPPSQALPMQIPPAARPSRNARIERFRRARLARCRGEGAGSRPLHGGSSHHFARVTSPFPATHRSIYLPPAATLLARSPLFLLRLRRCSPLLSSSLLHRFFIDSWCIDPLPSSLTRRCSGSEFLDKQVVDSPFSPSSS